MNRHTFVIDDVTTVDLAGDRMTVVSMGCNGVLRDSSGRFVAVSLRGDGSYWLSPNSYETYREAAVEATHEVGAMHTSMKIAYEIADDIEPSKDSDNVLGTAVESPEGNDEVIRTYNAFSVRETANGKFRCYMHTGKKLHTLPGLYATKEKADEVNAVSMSIAAGLVIDPKGTINDLMCVLADRRVDAPVADMKNFS